MKSRAVQVLVLSAPFAAILFVLAPYLWPPDRAPGSYFSDIHHQHGPNVMLLANGLRDDGELPRWNPQDFAGAPAVGDLQVGVYNPVYWLLLLRPTLHSMGVMIVAYALLGALGFVLYARQLGCTPLAAAVGAVAFTMGGKLLLHLVLPGHTVKAPFFLVPLLLWCVEHVARRPDRRRVAAAAIVGALIAVSLHPQVLFYSGWLVLALGVVFMRCAARPLRAFTGLAAAAALALSLAAVHLLPFFGLAGEFSRAHPQLYDVARWDLEHPDAHPRALELVLGTSASWEAHYYFGGVTAWLAAVALLAWPRRSPGRRHAWAHGIPALFLLLYGLGPAGGIQPLLAGLPGFGQFRLPARALVVLGLPVAVLAALGIDALRSAPTLRCRRTAAGSLAAVTALLVAAGGEPVHFALLALAAAGAAALGLARGRRTARNGDPEAAAGSIASAGLEAAGSALLLLAIAIDTGRAIAPWVQTMPEVEAARLAPGVVLPDRPDRIGRIAEVGRDTVAPGIPELAKRRYGLETLAGYNSLVPWRFIIFASYASGYSPFAHNIGDTVPIRRARPGLFDLLGVTHVLAGPDAAGRWQWEHNPGAFPRAYLVPAPVVVPEGTAGEAIPAELRALARLEQLDPRETVILHGATARSALAAAGADGSTPLEPFRPISPVARSANRITLEVAVDRPAILVLNEPFFHGWRAWDGRVEIPVLRANVLFRALALGPGRHEILLEFDPRSWRIGWWISLAALGLVGGLLVVPRRRPPG
jgi:hypothetical protein